MFAPAIAANMTDPALYTTTATASFSYSQVLMLKQLFMTQWRVATNLRPPTATKHSHKATWVKCLPQGHNNTDLDGEKFEPQTFSDTGPAVLPPELQAPQEFKDECT